MKLPDWLIRALKTFVQAAVSFIVADITVLTEAVADWNAGKHALLTLGVGAVAAGISAAWNIVLEMVKE